MAIDKELLKLDYDPYVVLNLSSASSSQHRQTVTPEEIKASYRLLAKKYHPDTWSASCFTDDERNNATAIFQRVSAANAILTDPIRKQQYDTNYNLGMYKHINSNKNNNSHGNTKRTTTSGGRGTGASSSSSSSSSRHNSSTSSSSRAQSRQQAPAPPLPPSGIPPPLPTGWTTVQDPRSGNLYYYHTRSGKSSWNHPMLCSNTSQYNTNSNTNTTTSSNNTSSNNNFRYYDGGYGNSKDYPGQRKPRPSWMNSNNNRNTTTAHPNTNRKNNNGNYAAFEDENINAGGRKVIVDDEPYTHRCGALCAVLLCPVVGMLALYHSIMVTQCWTKAKEYKKYTTKDTYSKDRSTDDDESDETEKLQLQDLTTAREKGLYLVRTFLLLPATKSSGINLRKSRSLPQQQKHQEDVAERHSQRAAVYACLGNCVGIGVVVWYLFMKNCSNGNNYNNNNNDDDGSGSGDSNDENDNNNCLNTILETWDIDTKEWDWWPFGDNDP